MRGLHFRPHAVLAERPIDPEITEHFPLKRSWAVSLYTCCWRTQTISPLKWLKSKHYGWILF